MSRDLPPPGSRPQMCRAPVCTGRRGPNTARWYLRIPPGFCGRLRARRLRRRCEPWAGALYRVESPARWLVRSVAFWVAVTVAGAAIAAVSMGAGLAIVLGWLT